MTRDPSWPAVATYLGVVVAHAGLEGYLHSTLGRLPWWTLVTTSILVVTPWVMTRDHRPDPKA